VTEASVDAVFEIAQSFAERVLSDGVANETYAEDKTHYVHVFLGGYPSDGFDHEHARGLAAKLEAVAGPLGWFVAKTQFDEHRSQDADEHPDEEPQTMCFVDLFPLVGRIVVPDAALWHVSPRSVRESILEHGLRPSTGGSDFITTANARVYVALDDDDAHCFAEDMRRLRDGWDEYDLWRIDPSVCARSRWCMDVEAPGMGAWTTVPIPPAALELRS